MYSYSVHQNIPTVAAATQDTRSKNVQAGSQTVGKGLNSISNSTQTLPTNIVKSTLTTTCQPSAVAPQTSRKVESRMENNKDNYRPILPKQQRSSNETSLPVPVSSVSQFSDNRVSKANNVAVALTPDPKKDDAG